MIFRTSQAGISTSAEGYGNTSYNPSLRLYLPLILR